MKTANPGGNVLILRALKATRSPMKFSVNIEDPDASLEIEGSLALFAQDGHLLMRAQGQANSLARAQLRKDLADIWILANTRHDVFASRLSFKIATVLSKFTQSFEKIEISTFRNEINHRVFK